MILRKIGLRSSQGLALSASLATVFLVSACRGGDDGVT